MMNFFFHNGLKRCWDWTRKNNEKQMDDFMFQLWEQLALLHKSPRVTRRGRVNAESGIRESNLQVLWPLPKQTTEEEEETGTLFVYSVFCMIRVLEEFRCCCCCFGTAHKSELLMILFFLFSTGPNSPGWITVTEQGIQQSFDMTKVMFSRGNITGFDLGNN